MPTLTQQQINHILNNQNIEKSGVDLGYVAPDKARAMLTTVIRANTAYSDNHSQIVFSNDVFTEGETALKKLYKLAIYLNTNPREKDQTKKDIFLKMYTHIQHAQYAEALKIYDQAFKERDWEQAALYFENHPDETYCGRKNGLMYSYVKTGEKIIQRRETLGEGFFGRTRVGHDSLDTTSLSAIKRQKKISGNFQSWFNFVWIEANINYDLGIARSKLVIRRKNGLLYKVYQDMLHLGHPVDKVLKKNQASDHVQLEYAIDLLLKVDALHSGNASKQRKPYAHCDIKPSNVMIDNDGMLHLIDFGLARSQSLHTSHTTHSGTPLYLPFSFDPLNPNAVTFDYVKKSITTTPSYFFDDKIATLRTIYHPLRQAPVSDSILSEAVFKALPPYVAALLDTSNIQTCIEKDQQYTIRLIAAVLILYRYDKQLTQSGVESLLNNPSEQNIIIESYQHAKSKLHKTSKDNIGQLLLEDDISMKYIPADYIDSHTIASVAKRDHLDQPLLTKLIEQFPEPTYEVMIEYWKRYVKHHIELAKTQNEDLLYIRSQLFDNLDGAQNFQMFQMALLQYYHALKQEKGARFHSEKLHFKALINSVESKSYFQRSTLKQLESFTSDKFISHSLKIIQKTNQLSLESTDFQRFKQRHEITTQRSIPLYIETLPDPLPDQYFVFDKTRQTITYHHDGLSNTVLLKHFPDCQQLVDGQVARQAKQDNNPPRDVTTVYVNAQDITEILKSGEADIETIRACAVTTQ